MRKFYLQLSTDWESMGPEFTRIKEELADPIECYYRELPLRPNLTTLPKFLNYFTTPDPDQVAILSRFYLAYAESELFKNQKIARTPHFCLDYDSNQGNTEFSARELWWLSQTGLGVAITHVSVGLRPFPGTGQVKV